MHVALYPKWQEFLRIHQPKTIIFWGRDDIFFTREGGEPLRGGGLPRLHLEAHTPLLP